MTVTLDFTSFLNEPLPLPRADTVSPHVIYEDLN